MRFRKPAFGVEGYVIGQLQIAQRIEVDALRWRSRLLNCESADAVSALPEHGVTGLLAQVVWGDSALDPGENASGLAVRLVRHLPAAGPSPFAAESRKVAIIQQRNTGGIDTRPHAHLGSERLL